MRKEVQEMFDAGKVTKDCIDWIRDFFEQNGQDCNAVVGISGGKDSSVVAALCVEALGKERVIGVLMPCGEQGDIDMAYRLVQHLGIRYFIVNIKESVDAVTKSIGILPEISVQTKTNLPARVRMTTLYAVSQSMNGRVANTCNLTVTEVKKIGMELGLPAELVEKTPIDGLCGKTDEENLGFTYAELDEYIRHGVIKNMETKARIDSLHHRNQFKIEPMPGFVYK